MRGTATWAPPSSEAAMMMLLRRGIQDAGHSGMPLQLEGLNERRDSFWNHIRAESEADFVEPTVT